MILIEPIRFTCKSDMEDNALQHYLVFTNMQKTEILFHTDDRPLGGLRQTPVEQIHRLLNFGFGAHFFRIFTANSYTLNIANVG